MNEKVEELELLKELLASRNLTFEDHIDFYDERNVKRDFMHCTVYVPKKEDFIFLISFDIPFDGYRFSKGKQYYTRFDKDIDEITEEVKKYGRRKV